MQVDNRKKAIQTTVNSPINAPPATKTLPSF